MTTEQPQSGRSKALLGVVLCALALVVAAVPALNIALPSVARDTGATESDLQWVVDSYALVFAGLLLPAGALGDRYGRKPVLVAGLLIFALASAAGATCASPAPLIAARAVMGVGAAMIMPTTLSIITTSLPLQQRAKAIGTWIGVAGAGAILGLLVSGTLLERWGWQSVFWLNATLASSVAVAAIVGTPNSVDERRPDVDYLGGALVTLCLAGVVFGAIEGPERGWTGSLTVGAFLAAGVAGTGWLAWSLTAKSPILDPRLFRSSLFTAGVLSIAAQFFVFFGFIFLIIQYVQLVLGYGPLQAGLALLPMGITLGAISRSAPRVGAHLSRRAMSAGGLALMAVGMAVLSRLTQDASYWQLLAGILPVGAGMALATAPATDAIVAALPTNKQGVASAVNDAAREVGGTLGIAVLGSILNGAYRSGVAHAIPSDATGQAHRAVDSLPAAIGIAKHLGPAGEGLARIAQQSFVHGATHAFAISAVLMLVASVALAALGRPSHPNPSNGSPAAAQLRPATLPGTRSESRPARMTRGRA